SSMGTSKPETELSDIEIFFLALFLARRRALIFRNEIERSGVQYQVFLTSEILPLMIKYINTSFYTPSSNFEVNLESSLA
nr:hypothetical protein [Parachlamydiaceae bacterium]